MEKSNALSDVLEGLKEIKEEEKTELPNCEFCGKASRALSGIRNIIILIFVKNQ